MSTFDIQLLGTPHDYACILVSASLVELDVFYTCSTEMNGYVPGVFIKYPRTELHVLHPIFQWIERRNSRLPKLYIVHREQEIEAFVGFSIPYPDRDFFLDIWARISNIELPYPNGFCKELCVVAKSFVPTHEFARFVSTYADRQSIDVLVQNEQALPSFGYTIPSFERYAPAKV